MTESHVDEKKSAGGATRPLADLDARVAPGLDGVVVAETRLAHVDGEAGRLVLRGVPIERLAGHEPFEAVCHLLWHGRLPTRGELERLRGELARARARAFAKLGEVGDALEADDGMAALRAALAHLRPRASATPGRAEAEAHAQAQAQAERIEITGALAVFAAAWARRALFGERPLPPDRGLGHAADYLRMIVDGGFDARRARALETYLVTTSEHGMCASTFTARVVASTRSDAVSAIVAAIGALKGPLHGGAPGPVLDMLDAIAAPDRAEAWLRARLDAGERIMGMGHRVYRVRDPRAAVLEAALAELVAEGDAPARWQLARAVETAAGRLLAERHPDRPMAANVEFNTALLLDAVGLERRLFSPTFAVARVAGWLAHVDEERDSGRIVRPRARYVGPLPEAG